MARQPRTVRAGAAAPAQPQQEPAGVFSHDQCLYRGKDGEETRVFRKGDQIPAKSEGWRDHPRQAD